MIVCFLKNKKPKKLCGKGDNSNLNIDTMNWITDKHASKTPQPNELNLGSQSEKKNCLRRPYLSTDWDKMSNLYKRTFHRCFPPSFGSFGHAVSEEISRSISKHGRHRQFMFMIVCFLKNKKQKKLCGKGDNSNLNIDTMNWITDKHGLWRPCLLTDRNKMSNLYRGPSIDASYQVSVHLAEGF
jgi:hypothetical protein